MGGQARKQRTHCHRWWPCSSHARRPSPAHAAHTALLPLVSVPSPHTCDGVTSCPAAGHVPPWRQPTAQPRRGGVQEARPATAAPSNSARPPWASPHPGTPYHIVPAGWLAGARPRRP